MKRFFAIVFSTAFLLSCSSACPIPGDFRFTVERVSDQAELLTRTAGGATLRLNGDDLSGRHLYSVAIHPEEERQISGYPSSAEIKEYVVEHLDVLAREESCLGTWYDPESGETSLDLAVTVRDRDAAEALAERYHQKAYYDLFHHEEIRLPAEAEPWNGEEQ